MTTTNEELIAQLAEAQTKISQLELEKRNNKTNKIEIKVSDKGCVQINGIRKFPISLYRNEIEQILNMKNDIENFININSEKLHKK